MLNAKSLRWSDTGAALFTVNRILDTLKIRDAVKATHNMQSAPPQLGTGEYEINLYPLSEILANRNVRNVGPVIPELQVPVVVTAAVSAVEGVTGVDCLPYTASGIRHQGYDTTVDGTVDVPEVGAPRPDLEQHSRFAERSVTTEEVVVQGTGALGDEPVEASNLGNVLGKHCLTLVR